MKKMLDLCSGLGGASEAFLQSENWEVKRIENNPILTNIPETTIMDVKTLATALASNRPGHIDLIWGSPPCRDFSSGFSSPKSIAVRAGKLDEYEPDLSIVLACLEIIRICKPTHWVIENVVGSIRYLTPILGEPRQIVGPYVLWGNFPLINNAKAIPTSKKSKDVHSGNPLRANLKAKIPIELSQGLLDSIEQQKTLHYWF